jgi:hypothetical protein
MDLACYKEIELNDLYSYLLVSIGINHANEKNYGFIT